MDRLGAPQKGGMRHMASTSAIRVSYIVCDYPIDRPVLGISGSENGSFEQDLSWPLRKNFRLRRRLAAALAIVKLSPKEALRALVFERGIADAI